jgi:TetR/AcrR family transcriptional regulator
VAAGVRRGPGRPRDDARRAMLVEAALRLLQTTPPSDLSRLDIARAAGVDPALIRYYFGDKYYLCAEVIARIAAEIVGETNAALAIAGTPQQRLAAFVRALHAVHVRHPHYHQLILDQITHGRKDPMRAMRAEMSGTLRETLTELMRAGAAAGEMRVVDPGLLGIAIIGMCEYFSSSWGPVKTLLGDDPGARQAGIGQAYATFIADFVGRGLRPD